MAPWILIALALVPAAVLVVLAAFLGSVPTNPDDFELPSYAEYYEFAIIPLALFAAVVAPLLVCPDRRDGVLSLYAARPITPTRLRRVALAGFFTVAAPWLRSPRRSCSSGTCSTRTTPARGSGTTGTWRRVSSRRPRSSPSCFTTLALFVASFTTRRAYAAIATVAVLFIGGAVGGIAHDNFNGALVEGALAEADLMRSLVDAVHWIFGRRDRGGLSRRAGSRRSGCSG